MVPRIFRRTTSCVNIREFPKHFMECEISLQYSQQVNILSQTNAVRTIPIYLSYVLVFLVVYFSLAFQLKTYIRFHPPPPPPPPPLTPLCYKTRPIHSIRHIHSNNTR
jgi:hypothetical protein